jgi:hypothetical protein
MVPCGRHSAVLWYVLISTVSYITLCYALTRTHTYSPLRSTTHNSPLRSTLPYFHLYVWPAEYLRNPPVAWLVRKIKKKNTKIYPSGKYYQKIMRPGNRALMSTWNLPQQILAHVEPAYFLSFPLCSLSLSSLAIALTLHQWWWSRMTILLQSMRSFRLLKWKHYSQCVSFLHTWITEDYHQ